jgi:hypothetical protein
MRHVEGAKHEGIQQAKDGSVRANAQRQREDRRRCKAPITT